MLGAPNEGEEESWELINADGTTSHEPWILLGRRDRKIAAFVDAGANDAGTDAQPHPAEPRHETASAPPASERRSAVSALAALCGRPRGVMAPRNGRAVSPPGPAAKKKRGRRKLRPFAGRPKTAGRLRQLYP